MSYATARAVDFSEIPVVDLGAAPAATAAAVRRAAIDVGFFYVRNHGVARAVVADAYAVSRRFFLRPVEEKQRVAVNARHRGFIRARDSVCTHCRCRTCRAVSACPGRSRSQQACQPRQQAQRP